MNENLKKIGIVAAILAVVGYVLFILFFNFGEVVVSGKAPFSLLVEGKETVCETNECILKLPAKSLIVDAKKVGYKEFRFSVQPNPFQKQYVLANFEFLPVLKEKKPIEESDLIEVNLENKEVVRRSDIEGNVYKLIFDTDGKQKLKKFEGGAEKIVAVFPRRMSNADFAVSLDEKWVLLVDKSLPGDDKVDRVYLIDLELGKSVLLGEWAGVSKLRGLSSDSFLIEQLVDGKFVNKAFVSGILNVVDVGNFDKIELANGKFYFIDESGALFSYVSGEQNVLASGLSNVKFLRVDKNDSRFLRIYTDRGVEIWQILE